MSEPKKVDNYSILIVAKYLQTSQDYINLVCVCKNFKKTLKKFRYNPIPVHKTNLFPLMQTQFLYSPYEKRIEDVDLYRICYPIPYHKYLEYQKEGNIKCSKVYFDEEDAREYKGDIPEIVHSLGNLSYKDLDCVSLTLPTHITLLEENCFARMTDLTTIELSPHLNSLPFGCFQVCVQLENVVIPTSITSIGGYSFNYCMSLKNIVIPDSVSYINDFAFQECASLESITLSKSLKGINSRLFIGCKSLTSIEIPENVTIISQSAFEECTSLQSVKIPLNLKVASLYAFKNCQSLTSLHIPSTCTYIGEGIISGCTSLRTIRFPTDKYGYYIHNIKYDDYQILNKSINKFRRLEWNRNETINNEPQIPYECNYLAKECYKDCEIREAVLPNNIRSIKENCFQNCSLLTSVYLPDSVTYLNNNLFENCINLIYVRLSRNAKFLSFELFKNCEKLQHIDFPTRLTKIKSDCFHNCKSLTSIHIPDGCQIMRNCFVGCTSLKELTLPNENGIVDCEVSPEEYEIIRKFGYKCKNVLFIAEDKEKEIPNFDYPFALGRRAMSGSTKESIIIPSNVTRIYHEAFFNCTNLTSIVIPEGCVKIGKLAFKYCKQLEEITIPSTVTRFGDLFLEECMNLKKVNVPNNILLGPVQMEQAFLIESLGVKCPNICIIDKDYQQLKTIPPQVKMIGAFCFQGNNTLKSINIPTTIEELGYRAFYECSNLTSVTIPSSITKIGFGCFDGCCELRHIEMNARVTKLKNETFHGCTWRKITLPTTIQQLGEQAISASREVVEITIPSSITSVKESLVTNCPKLTKLTFDDNCQLEVLSEAFMFFCQKIKEISLPTSITRIENDVFNDCVTLSKITMPNVKHIEQCSFNNCFELSTVELPTTLTYLGPFTFQFCCNLREMKIPQNVQILNESIFLNCDSLTSVTLPTSLKFENVHHSLFRKCSSLKEIYIGNRRVSNLYPFKVTYSIMLQFKTIGIKCEEVVLTREDVYLHKELLMDEPIPKEVKYLDDHCFRNVDYFKKITIHRNVVAIGEGCFNNCFSRIRNKSRIKINL